MSEINYGFIAKYGFLNFPMTVDADLISDALVSVKHCAYGATTAPVGKTFSEDYIAGRDSKYISPDKQVDLSTCRQPDKTWVVKGAHHDVIDCLYPIIFGFLNGTNEDAASVYNKTGFTQFLVYDYDENNYDTGVMTNMTADNCADYDFISRPVEEPTTETRVVSFMRFFTMIIEFFTKLFNGTLDFSNLFG